MQFADLALAGSQEAHAGEAEALEDVRDVLLVARQSVERLGDDRVERAAARLGEQSRRLRPVLQRAARYRKIGVDADNSAAEPCNKIPAQRDLVVDRPLVLLLRGVARVDRDPHLAVG